MDTLEHANLHVKDIARTARFLTDALPTYRVRHHNTQDQWMHVGNDNTYLAISPFKSEPQAATALLHLGFIVDDVDEIKNRLDEAGYPPGYADGQIIEETQRRRLYYLDHDGCEYEFVQYLTEDPTQRHAY